MDNLDVHGSGTLTYMTHLLFGKVARPLFARSAAAGGGACDKWNVNCSSSYPQIVRPWMFFQSLIISSSSLARANLFCIFPPLKVTETMCRLCVTVWPRYDDSAAMYSNTLHAWEKTSINCVYNEKLPPGRSIQYMDMPWRPVLRVPKQISMGNCRTCHHLKGTSKLVAIGKKNKLWSSSVINVNEFEYSSTKAFEVFHWEKKA